MYFSHLSMIVRILLLLLLVVCLSVCMDNKDNNPNMDTGILPDTTSLSNDQITGHNNQAHHTFRYLTEITDSLPPARYGRHALKTNHNSKQQPTNPINTGYNDTQPDRNDIILPDNADNLKGLLALAKCRAICPIQVSDMATCKIQVSEMVNCTIQVSEMVICKIQVSCMVICKIQVSTMVICKIQISCMVISTIQVSAIVICTIQVSEMKSVQYRSVTR